MVSLEKMCGKKTVRLIFFQKNFNYILADIFRISELQRLLQFDFEERIYCGRKFGYILNHFLKKS